MSSVSVIEPMKRLAISYNRGELKLLGFAHMSLSPKTISTYPTSRSAIIIPIKGKATFSFDHIKLEAKRGRLLHGTPNHMLIQSNEEATLFDYYILYYDNTGKDNDLIFSCEVEDVDELLNILSSIVALNTNSSLQANYRKNLLIDEFFAFIFKSLQIPTEQSENELLEDTLKYIHENYNKDLKLSTLANHVGTSEEHLSYIFFKHLKIRPIDYLIDHRIKSAITLIQEDEVSIKEASAKVGYQDSCYFSRLFKKRMGFSPGRLKRY